MKKISEKFRILIATVILFSVSVFQPNFISTSSGEAFTVSVHVPPSTGLNFTVSKVIDGVFTPQQSNNLDFGTLSYVAELGVFLSPHYFFIDVDGEGGVGIPDIIIQYNETGSPDGAIADLGDRIVFSYSSVVTINGIEAQNVIDIMSLKQANGTQISDHDLDGGYLRIGIGIATGIDGIIEGDAEPFTMSDAAGTYTGVLTITAVVS